VMTNADNGEIGGHSEDGCEYNGVIAGRGYAPYGFGLVGFVSKTDVTLMAAAPELLEALRSATDYILASGSPDAMEVTKDYRAVIAKALNSKRE